jgi:hypothetical protein
MMLFPGLNYYLGMTGSVSFDRLREGKYIGRTESNLPNHFPAWPTFPVSRESDEKYSSVAWKLEIGNKITKLTLRSLLSTTIFKSPSPATNFPRSLSAATNLPQSLLDVTHQLTTISLGCH